MEQPNYDDYLTNLFAGFTHYASGDSLYVTFTMDAFDWRKARERGLLGHIYNADLSNMLGRLGILNFYAMPIVNDHARAKAGRKTIKVEFRKGVK